MANTILTPSLIAKETLRQLNNNLHYPRLVHRQLEKEFKKVGDTVTVRLPNKFVVVDGQTAVDRDLKEPSVDFTLNKYKNISWAWSSKDLTLSIEEYSKRYLAPAMATLANQVDYDVAQLAADVYNFVGTAGALPVALSDITNVMRRMTHEAIPSPRVAVMDPYAYNGMISGDFKSFYSKELTEDAVERGLIEMAGGMRMFESANNYVHTSGTFDIASDTPVFDASGGAAIPAANGDTTVRIRGIAIGKNATILFKKGDVFTIAGVYAVNPVGRQRSPYLRDFVVTADCTYTHSDGFALVSISPALYSSTSAAVDLPYQTINTLPVNSAVVSLKCGNAGAVNANSLFFHEQAFALCVAPIDLPESVSWKARESANGISIRIIKQFDSQYNTERVRLDILYGVKTIRPDLAVRLTS